MSPNLNRYPLDSWQNRKSRLQVFALTLSALLAASACSVSQPTPITKGRGLSITEQEAIHQASEAQVSLIVLQSDGSLRAQWVARESVAEFESQVLEQDPEATLALNASVALGHESGENAQPDENLLFRGKLELGLQDWEAAHPLADGRGVTVGVVDDGVALHRPGLITTRGSSLPKFAGALTLSPIWQLPIRSQEQGVACPAPRPARTEAKSAQWVLPSEWTGQIIRRIPFDFSACGINPELPLAPSSVCASWKNSIPQLSDSQKELPAAYFELQGSVAQIAVDLNGDGALSSDEIFRPLSEDGNSYRLFSPGTALAFDLHSGDSYPDPDSDHPSHTCWKGNKPQKILTMTLPHEGSQFGAHGEGVAAIAVGYQIGGKALDGMAPGARLFDVHFGDPAGGRRYTIAELTRALLAAGKKSDIVNLSYSLFFSSPASQVAMSRMISAVLGQTEAIYHFSAGNNGPGRGSMNRALLYPQDAIVVGAYLDPLLAQTTFGSSTPYGGIVSYSSRGPSPDGGLGALILGPLAGIVPSTPNSGFGPFSGTSSATPAIAGFTARLISQLKQEGLPIRRDWVRRALMISARPLPGEAAVDQGWGLPWLPEALRAYQKLAKEELGPELSFSHGTAPTGVTRRGIFVVADRERRDVYATRLLPNFNGSQASAQAKADYAEIVSIESNAPWVRVPPAAFVSLSGVNVDVALDWDWLEAHPGEHLAEVVVKSKQGGTQDRRALLPVTVIIPHTSEWEGALNVQANPGQVHRFFVQKPAGSRATHLVLSRESLRAGQPLCGRFGVYDPSGASAPGLVQGTPMGRRAELAISANEPGVYEVLWVGGNSHTACPRTQFFELTWQWVHLETSQQQARLEEKQVIVEGVATTEAPSLRGVMTFTPVKERIPLELRPTREANGWRYQTQYALNLSNDITWEVRIAPETLGLVTGRARLPSWALELTLADAPEKNWPAETVLDAKTGRFSSLSLGGMSPSTSAEVKLNWSVSAFEAGAAMGSAPPVLQLELRSKSQSLRSVKTSSAPLEFTSANLSRFELTLPLDAVQQSKEWSCSFQPLGFNLSIECPALTSPAGL
jgi:subtilisin family serine protease